MIKVHIGLKGSGKTPKIIEAVNTAIDVEKGNVVCITDGDRLMHTINRKARLVNTEQLLQTKEYIAKKYKAKKYIAYFQNYTNT